MAVELTATPIARGGVSVLGVAADSTGNKVSNTGDEFVIVENTHSSAARTLTFVTTRSIDGIALDDRVEVLSAGKTEAFGPWTTIYNDVDRKVTVTYSTHSNLMIQALKLTRASG